MQRKHLIVYTAVFGRSDILKNPVVKLGGIDLVCYTDMEFTGESAYEFVKIELDDSSSSKQQRHIKIFWPPIFNRYEYSLYLDSNIWFKVDPGGLIELLSQDSDILLFRHPERNCLYEEAKACLRMRKETRGDVIAQQLQKYRSEGYPEHHGLYAGGILFRRHSEEMRKFSKMWLAEVMKFSARDQISLPYILWKTELKVSVFPSGTLWANRWFDCFRHRLNPAFRKDLNGLS